MKLNRGEKLKIIKPKKSACKDLSNNGWKASNFNDEELIYVIPKESEIAYKKGCKGGEGG